MLVLSRRRDESIMIGDSVKVTIVDVRGDRVKLGIDAPKSIPVHREEIYDAIQEQKKKSPDPENKESLDVDTCLYTEACMCTCHDCTARRLRDEDAKGVEE